MRVLSALIAVAVPFSPLMAEDSILPVEEQIRSLIADLEAGKKDQAAERISGIFTFGDENDRLVTTSKQFAELVAGCKPTQLNSQKFRTGSVVHNFRWNCGGLKYEASLGVYGESGLIEVVDVEDEARANARLSQKNLPISLPMPRKETAEDSADLLEQDGRDRSAVLAALEEAIRQGRASPSTSFVNEKSNFTLGYQLLESSTFVAEMDGNGTLELDKQFSWVKENLGNVVDVSCKQSPLGGDTTFVFMSCSAKTDRPGHGLTAILYTNGRFVRRLQINYFNEKSYMKNIDYLKKQSAGN